MTMGAGKTRTAVNLCYRLLRYRGAERVLFLVDRSNLCKQVEREFRGFSIAETGRKFNQEYIVQRVHSAIRLDRGHGHIRLQVL